MARTITFDPLTVVHKATDLFWRQGFRNTSVDDIVTRTGLNKHSLYGRFGNKHGLFRACLQHYIDSVTAAYRQPLEQGRGMQALRDFFSGFLAGNSARGCLITRSVSELKLLSKDNRQILRDYYQRYEDLFYRRLCEAETDGELRAGVDCGEAAKLLLCVVQGAVIVGMERPDAGGGAVASVLGLLVRG